MEIFYSNPSLNKIKNNTTKKKKGDLQKNKKQPNKTQKNNSLPLNIRVPNYSESDKREIIQQINPISLEDATKSFEKLQQLKCKGAIASSGFIRIGNDVVDYFTLIERLATKGNKGIDFYTFYYNRNVFSKMKYIQNMLKYYKSRDISEIRKWKYIFNMYFSSISIFRPVMAMEIYCRYSPKHAILDYTMGWGGRLVGACALNSPKYIGIDSNIHLKPLYHSMQEFLTSKTTTQMEFYFQDALKMDYSKLYYDVVFTSPPYYDIEVYRANKNRESNERFKTKDEWNELFYKPIIERTWKHMKSPGYYCLNVPVDIYDSCCVPVLGNATKKHILKKSQRFREITNPYTEYIYVWYK